MIIAIACKHKILGFSNYSYPFSLPTNRTPSTQDFFSLIFLPSPLQECYKRVSGWLARPSQKPTAIPEKKLLTCQGLPTRAAAACFNNANEASCNTNSDWKKINLDCGKVQLKKQTLQALVEHKSKQRFLNTKLNCKSSTVPYFSLLSFALLKIEPSMS